MRWILIMASWSVSCRLRPPRLRGLLLCTPPVTLTSSDSGGTDSQSEPPRHDLWRAGRIIVCGGHL